MFDELKKYINTQAQYGAGATLEVQYNIHTRINQQDKYSSFFFNKMKSTEDWVRKGLSPLTAPISYGYFALSLAVDALTSFFEAIQYLFHGDTLNSIEKANETWIILPAVALTVVMGIASPIINLVDFIGSSINTLRTPPADPAAAASAPVL